MAFLMQLQSTFFFYFVAEVSCLKDSNDRKAAPQLYPWYSRLTLLALPNFVVLVLDVGLRASGLHMEADCFAGHLVEFGLCRLARLLRLFKLPAFLFSVVLLVMLWTRWQDARETARQLSGEEKTAGEEIKRWAESLATMLTNNYMKFCEICEFHQI